MSFRFLIFSVCIVHYFFVFADPSWSPSKGTIAESKEHTPFDVYSSADPLGHFMVVWKDAATQTPFYALYSSGTWTVPASITGGSSFSSSPVYCASHSSGEFLVTWKDAVSKKPFYALSSSSSSFAQGAKPVPGARLLGKSDVFCSASPSGTFLITWIDSATGLPFYSLFEGENWSKPEAIAHTKAAPGCTVVSSSDSSSMFLATWKDVATGLPFYSFYDGAAWSVPLALGLGETASAIFSVGNGMKSFATVWVDLPSGTPVFSLYKEESWSSPEAVPEAGSAAGSSITASTGSDGSCLFSWKDSVSGEPFYAVYRKGSWVVTARGIGNGIKPADSSVFSSASPFGGFLLTWKDFSTQRPFYAFYDVPNPPSNLKAIKKNSHFGTINHVFFSLSWSQSTSPYVTGYSLYRDGEKIASLDVGVTSYEDHAPGKNAFPLYSLTAFHQESSSFPIFAQP